MRNLYFVILALLIGCAKPSLKDDNMLTITAFSTSFETKASETAFESDDKIGIFLENNAGNLRYETSDGSTWRGFGSLGEFKTGDNAIAYYPYSQTATDMSAIEISSGVDFMICPKTPLQIVDNKASAALNFKHVLSKLVVSMEIPSEIAGVKTVSLESITVKNVYRKGIIDLATEKITALDHRGDVVLTSGEAIIIPQTISRIEFVFKMVDGTFMKQAYPESLLLESGKRTTFKAISNADLYFTSTLNLLSGEAQTDLPLSFYVAPGRTWTLKSSEPWLTFSATTGVGAATVKVNVAQNAGVPRTATITLKDDKQAVTTQSPTQNYIKKYPVVKIGDTYWTTANLTGTKQGQTTGFTTCANPQDYGMFWKWGSLYMYDRNSNGNPSGHWRANTTTIMAATYPTEQSRGYDYVGLSSSWGAPVGDPCKSLGNYRTPTQAQWQQLFDSGHSSVITTYQNVTGVFLGEKATLCNNTKIQNGCIFLPAAGIRNYYDGLLSGIATGIIDGNYWSSSVFNPTNGWHVYMAVNINSIGPDGNNGSRGYAMSVRCVAE